MVSGGVDLIETVKPAVSEMQAAYAIGQAQYLLAIGMGNGRIDLFRALAASGQQPGGL
jgi:hypothetical protein